MFCSCAGGAKEGFDLIGSNLEYSMGNGVKGSWDNRRIENEKKWTYKNWYNQFDNNTGGPVPLPNGELLIFDKNKSDPSCCPATYSTSTGCICATTEQMKYLNERGGNRTLTTEF